MRSFIDCDAVNIKKVNSFSWTPYSSPGDDWGLVGFPVISSLIRDLTVFHLIHAESLQQRFSLSTCSRSCNSPSPSDVRVSVKMTDDKRDSPRTSN